VILRHLPEGSAYQTSLRDAAAAAGVTNGTAVPDPADLGQWTKDQMILAGIFDMVNDARWLLSDQKTPRPKPYPRPGTVALATVTPLNADAIAYLEEVERRHGAAPDADWVPPSRRRNDAAGDL
jgi:hypothetical protein